MKVNCLQFLAITFGLILNFKLNNGKLTKNRFNLPKEKSNTTMNIIGNGLLFTSKDSVSLIYPKELGYPNNLKQTIYKIKNKENSPIYEIQDSVFDRKTQSIYSLIIDYSNMVSHIIRLTYNQSDAINNQTTDIFYYDDQIAPKWSKTIIYNNKTSLVISMNINIKQRKLYWLEKEMNNWSFVVKDLNILSVKYILLNNTFTGYLFAHLITVAYDNDKNIENDIIFFIGDENILYICFMLNKTCQDYFKSKFYSPSMNHDCAKEENELQSSDSEFDLVEIQSATKGKKKPLLEFGNLVDIYYDKKKHVLFFSDYRNYRIQKITFDKQSSDANFRFSKIETILQKRYGQISIPFQMSVFYNDYIFWIDVVGIKSIILNYQCENEIYTVDYSKSLRKL